MKLQEGIFFGRRKLALAVCLAALATGSAHATIYYSGRGSANGTLATAVKWYTNESRTVAADPQPTPTANDGNTYVFIESMKMDYGATFPEGDEPKFSAVICTVPSSQADLSTTLMPANLHGYKGRIEKDAETYASEGLVTYKATWFKTGLAIIFY